MDSGFSLSGTTLYLRQSIRRKKMRRPKTPALKLSPQRPLATAGIHSTDIIFMLFHIDLVMPTLEIDSAKIFCYWNKSSTAIVDETC